MYRLHKTLLYQYNSSLKNIIKGVFPFNYFWLVALYQPTPENGEMSAHAQLSSFISMGVPNTTCFFLNTWQPIQRGSSGLENHGWFIPQRAPHLSTGCVWYCRSVPFTSVKLSHNSGHKPQSNVVPFLSKSSHGFFNPLDPNEGTTHPMFLLFCLTPVATIRIGFLHKVLFEEGWPHTQFDISLGLRYTLCTPV